MLVNNNSQSRTEDFVESAALMLAQGVGLADFEDELDTGVRRIRMLATWAARRAEPPRQVGGGDRQP